jgi:hypothetical protein
MTISVFLLSKENEKLGKNFGGWHSLVLPFVYVVGWVGEVSMGSP